MRSVFDGEVYSTLFSLLTFVMQTSDTLHDHDTSDAEKTVSTPHSLELTSKFKVHDHDPYEVTLESEIDPKNLPTWRKWLAVLVINAGAICVSSSSSMVSFPRHNVPQREFVC